MIQSISSDKALRNRPVLWLVFIAYLVLLCITMAKHELWGDELHSWNIAKGSSSIGELLHTVRYEGHPPLWHILLWCITRISHDLFWMQALQFFFAILSVFLLLFRSALPLWGKALLPFGYYFLYEYGTLSRNYALAVSIAFLLCCVLQSKNRYRIAVYYLLLFLLNNTHILGLLLAASLHLYFILSLGMGKKTAMMGHALLGLLVALPAACFVLPPSDSQLSTGFWLGRWSFDQVVIGIQAPLRAFLPLPAWWNDHYWNTHFLLDLNVRFRWLRYLTPLLSLGIVTWAVYYLRSCRRSQALFLANVLLTFALGQILPLTIQRYTGFIFIGFITACWLKYAAPLPAGNSRNRAFNSVLGFQALAGIFMIVQDIRLPFSNMHRVGTLLAKVPPRVPVITDNWALNALSAYTDRAYYCTDLQREASFLAWIKTPSLPVQNRYCAGLVHFMREKQADTVYLVSVKSLPLLLQADDRLERSFKVTLISSIEGAVEKSSDLYLYRISLSYPLSLPEAGMPQAAPVKQ